MKTLNREEVVTAAVNIFGYGYSDFDGMGLVEVLNYLDFDQLEEIKGYYGMPQIHVTRVA